MPPAETSGQTSSILGRGLVYLFAFLAAASGLTLAVFIVRAVLGARQRKRNNENEAFRELPRLSWRERTFLVLLLVAIGLLGWWLWNEIPATERFRGATVVSRAREASDVVRSPRVLPLSEAGSRTSGLSIATTALLIASLAAIGGLTAMLWLILTGRQGAKKDMARSSVDFARDASEDLLRGAPLDDVVLACYRDMCRVLANRQEFREDMTAREFADSLRSQGLPAHDIDTLTELFEQVRYGHVPSGKAERVRAIEALAAIGRLTAERSP
jgi:NADH:ubiquinone oxidoreductase subunit 5 (subunit L)/multisubunit Na+/H+ antiporter MnhA subunit